MRRISDFTKSSGDEALVWINEKFISVVEIMEGSLCSIGFEVRTTIDLQNNIYTYVLSNGQQQGIIDLRRVLLDIATHQGEYDGRLANPLYEAAKMHRVIGEIVATVKVVFSDCPGVEITNQLCELSKRLGIKFSMVRSL